MVRRQETYEQIPSARPFEVAIQTLRTMAEEKRQSGRDLPFLNWRYILFVWNDSDAGNEPSPAAGRRDRRRSAVLGNHRSSRRSVFATIRAGLADLAAIRQEIWDHNELGNAIPGAMPQAHIDVRTLVPGLPLLEANGPAVARADTRAQSVDATISGARHLRPPAGATRRAAVRGQRHADRARFRASVVAGNLGPGEDRPMWAIEIPAVADQRGRYTLKFDSNTTTN